MLSYYNLKGIFLHFLLKACLLATSESLPDEPKERGVNYVENIEFDLPCS
jgi:hypothetical protein